MAELTEQRKKELRAISWKNPNLRDTLDTIDARDAEIKELREAIREACELHLEVSRDLTLKRIAQQAVEEGGE